MEQQQQQNQQQVEENKKSSYAKEYDDQKLIQEQENMLKQEILQSGPLISEFTQIDQLLTIYYNNEKFIQKLTYLLNSTPYKHYRQIRRDGSCFYRAYLFAIVELILNQKDTNLLEKFETKIKQGEKDMLEIGIEQLIIEDFMDLAKDIIKNIKEQKLTTLEEALKIFLDEESSCFLIMLMRLMTTTYLKKNKEQFECFLMGQTIDQFCQSEVDPIDREADHLQIIALTNYLEIPISIIYLDQADQDKPSILKFPDTANDQDIKIHLLYRPGHYDLIYN